MGKPSLSQPQRDMNQQDQRRHLDQRPDHRREGYGRGQTEGGDATAIASSKLLPAAVKAMAVVRG